MKWKLLVSLILAISISACANMAVSRKDGGTINYSGPSSGAVAIANAEAHARATDAAGAVAIEAAKQGKPVSVHSQNGMTDVQSGYVYGGMYGGYGYGGVYGGDPANMTAAQGELMGRMLYPQLGQAPIYVQPGEPVSEGAKPGTRSIEQRLDRVERVQKVQVKNELKRR